MAELATVARPYAEALFRVAKSGDMVSWSNLMTRMSEIGAHPDVKELVSNPKLTDRQVSDTLLALLNSDIPAEAKNFIEVLVENGRVSLLPKISAQFHALKDADEGAANASIVSAFEMSESQIGELVATLGKKFGRKLNPTVSVDSSLIGGVCVTVGDEVLDLSVRAKLQQMHAALVS